MGLPPESPWASGGSPPGQGYCKAPPQATPHAADPLGNWLLVTGYWLLVTGYWLLVTGYWLLVTGYRLPYPPCSLGLPGISWQAGEPSRLAMGPMGPHGVSENGVSENGFPRQGSLHRPQKACILKMGILKMGSPGRGACTSHKKLVLSKWEF